MIISFNSNNINIMILLIYKISKYKNYVLLCINTIENLYFIVKT